MISIPYFKQIAKSNAKFLGVFTLVLCVFLIVMTMYLPRNNKWLSKCYEGNSCIAHHGREWDIDWFYVKFILCNYGNHFPYGLFYYGGQSNDS